MSSSQPRDDKVDAILSKLDQLGLSLDDIEQRLAQVEGEKPPTPQPVKPGLGKPPVPSHPGLPSAQAQAQASHSRPGFIPAPPPQVQPVSSPNGIGTVLAVGGGIILLIGLGLLLAFAVRNGLIGPPAREVLGALLSVGLIGASFAHYHKKKSALLAGTFGVLGVLGLFLVVIASEIDDILPATIRFDLALLISLSGVAYGRWKKSQGIALASIFGSLYCVYSMDQQPWFVNWPVVAVVVFCIYAVIAVSWISFNIASAIVAVLAGITVFAMIDSIEFIAYEDINAFSGSLFLPHTTSGFISLLAVLAFIVVCWARGFIQHAYDHRIVSALFVIAGGLPSIGLIRRAHSEATEREFYPETETYVDFLPLALTLTIVAAALLTLGSFLAQHRHPGHYMYVSLLSGVIGSFILCAGFIYRPSNLWLICALTLLTLGALIAAHHNIHPRFSEAFALASLAILMLVSMVLFGVIFIFSSDEAAFHTSVPGIGFFALLAICWIASGKVFARYFATENQNSLSGHGTLISGSVVGAICGSIAIILTGTLLGKLGGFPALGFYGGHFLVTALWLAAGVYLIVSVGDRLRGASSLGLLLACMAVLKLLIVDLVSLSGLSRILLFILCGIALLLTARKVFSDHPPQDPQAPPAGHDYPQWPR